MNLCSMAWHQRMLRDVEARKVGYWVSREYVMRLFKCISAAQGSEASPVDVEMMLMGYLDYLSVIFKNFIFDVCVCVCFPALGGV